MAAFVRPAGPSVPSPSTPHGSERRAASHRALPTGSCNYRDISLGAHAPTCGCRRFWQHNGRLGALQGDGASRRPAAEEPSCLCVCSHHACFHDATERPQAVSSDQKSPLPAASGEKAPVLVQLSSSNGEARFQLMAGSHPVSLQGLDHGKRLGVVITTPKGSAQNTHQDRPSSVVARFEQQAEQGAHRIVEQFSSPPDAQAGPSGPQIAATEAVQTAAQENRFQPSSIQPMNALAGSQVDMPLATLNMRPPSISTGLGLNLHGKPSSLFDQSPTPTVPDDPFEMAKLLNLSRREQMLPTSTPSLDGRLHNASLNGDFMQALNSRSSPAALPVEVPLGIPASGALHSWLQNDNDARAPSSKATPDLTEIQRFLEETRSFVEAIPYPASFSRDQQPQNTPGDMDAAGATSGQRPTTGTPEAAKDAADNIPAALRLSLQKLVPYLSGLLNHIQTYPNISTSLHQLSQRVEQLQNASFDYLAPDEVQNKFDLFEGRVLEIESRLDKHDELRAGAEADRGASFESNASGHSATSSALIQAAVGRLETDEKLKDVFGRLEILESSVPPSFSAPWEIEVILLPWGRALKGVWMAADETTQTLASALGTQNSDEWTQARSRKSVSVDPGSSFGSGHGGWTEQAIYEWAEATDTWLTPRACAPSGIVYKRLQSRGFVRKVTLTSSGARHVRAALTSAFKPILRRLDDARFNADGEISVASINDKVSVGTFLGLRETLVPLRKVRKSTRLKFLAPSELLTPALWNAQFLGSDVLMHAPGGRKRLFVTSRAAYLQGHQDEESGWSWQRLRELPRIADPDAADSAEDHAVIEADAREPCWAHHPNLDSPPASAESSFSLPIPAKSMHDHDSFQDGQSNDGEADALRPQSPRRPDGTPHPITPMTSEFPADRRQLHHRTISGPHTASAPTLVVSSSPTQAVPQRRVASFDQPSTRIRLRATPRRHTVDPRVGNAGRESSRQPIHRISESPPKLHRTKRRRVERSSDSDLESDEGEEPLDVLLRVAEGRRRNRQSSSEPLDVLLRVAEGTGSLTEAERSTQRSKARRIGRERGAQVGLAQHSLEDEDEYQSSANSSDQDCLSDNDENASGSQHQPDTVSPRPTRLSQTSHPTFMANPTPRLSREPTSPFKSNLDGFPRSSASTSVAAGPSNMDAYAAGMAKGSMMPYPTPYSGVGGLLSCGGDTQADSASLLGRASGLGLEEEAWEGVEENAGREREREDEDEDEDMDDDDDDEDESECCDDEHDESEDDGDDD